MNKLPLCWVLVVLFALAGSTRGAVNADYALNYGSGWTNEANGGAGFGAWTITATSGAGWAGNGIWASASADLSLGSSFGYVAKGVGASIALDRAFSLAMSTGDVFALDLGLNYDAGSGGGKGFSLRTADLREVIVVHQADSQLITLNGQPALTNYGTTTMHWTFTQKSSTQVLVYVTGRSGSESYTVTLTTSTPSFLANLHFYATNLADDAYADKRQVYFDNLTLSQGATSTNGFLYSVENNLVIITGTQESISGAITVPATLGSYPVTAVGRSAFKDRTNITSVSFAAGAIVTNLGPAAFQGCRSMTTAVLPSGITTLPVGLFYGCTGLVSVTVPTGVTCIDATAFADCRRLPSLALPAGLTNLGESVFLNCRGLNTLVFPDGLTHLPGQVCYENRALTSVGLPAALTQIGYSAFYNCCSLASVKIAQSLSTVGNWAFHSCTNLARIYFTGGVAGLSTGVFGNCSALTGVYVIGAPPVVGEDGGLDLFAGAAEATVFYLAESSGWSNTMGGATVETWTPIITSLTMTSGLCRLAVDWADGQTVRLQTCTNFIDADWVDQDTNTIIDGVAEFGPNQALTGEQRFYRVVPSD